MNNEANFVPSGSGQQQNEKIDDNSGSPSEQLEDNDDESEEKNTSESDSMDHYMDDIRDHEIHKKETGGQESGPEIENVAKDNAESTFVNEPPNIEQLLKPLDKQGE
jgi:hypothetical protein